MTNKQNMNLAVADPFVYSVATSTPAEQRNQIQQLFSRLAGLLDHVETWKLRHKTRNQLACASPDQLRDVGISESQRLIEINKSFWEA